jgi:predicted dehydrogenase
MDALTGEPFHRSDAPWWRSSTVEPFRFGIVGTGGIAQGAHLPAMAFVASETPVRLVACADVDAARAEAAAARWGAEAWYTDYRRLLERRDVDGVIVATPHPLHAAVAREAFLAGKHVLVQKPMATRWEDAQALREAWRTSGRVGMALPYSDVGGLPVLRELIAQGVLGQITMARCRVAHGGPAPGSWFYDRAVAGGGVLFDLGVYAVAHLVYLLGPVQQVAAHLTTTRTDTSVEDGAACLCALRGGGQAVVETSWCQVAGVDFVQLFGTEGTAYLVDEAEPRVVWTTRGDGAGGRRTWHVRRCPPPRPHMVEAHATWVRCCREGRQPENDIDRGAHVAAVLVAAYRAAAERTWCEVPGYDAEPATP